MKEMEPHKAHGSDDISPFVFQDCVEIRGNPPGMLPKVLLVWGSSSQEWEGKIYTVTIKERKMIER